MYPKNTTQKTTWRRCHEGFTEVYPRIYVGKAYDVDSKLLQNVDILIPLDHVDGTIWDTGWRGGILYIPIRDYSVLPKDVEKRFVEKTIDLYNNGKCIAIFCVGGHGRTGYFTSLILGKLGVDDPIWHLRNNYCSKAVEAQDQVRAIAEFLGKPELESKYKVQSTIGFSLYDYYYDDFRSSVNHYLNCCCDCEYFEQYSTYSYYGHCPIIGKTISKYEYPCNDFIKVRGV